MRTPVENSITFAQLCVLAHYVFDALGEDAPLGDVIDEALVAAHFASPHPDHLRRAVDAVQTARAKGYRAPVPKHLRLVRRRGEAC
jgi:hypothetical protein